MSQISPDSTFLTAVAQKKRQGRKNLKGLRSSRFWQRFLFFTATFRLLLCIVKVLQNHAFTLLELMVSFLISSIIMVAMFAFVTQFAGLFDALVQEEKNKSPIDATILRLENDLSYTNAVKVKSAKTFVEIRYSLPMVKIKNKLIKGKEVLWRWSRKKKNIIVTETWFQWKTFDYVENNRHRRKMGNVLDFEYVIPKEISFSSELVSNNKKIPILLIINIHTNRENQASKQSYFISLGKA